MEHFGLSVGLAILAILGCLAVYGASRIEDVERKYYEDLESKKLDSGH